MSADKKADVAFPTKMLFWDYSPKHDFSYDRSGSFFIPSIIVGRSPKCQKFPVPAPVRIKVDVKESQPFILHPQLRGSNSDKQRGYEIDPRYVGP